VSDAELRRLRAALGASAAARQGNPARWLEEEVAFLGALAEALDRPELLGGVWRDLRMRTTALAADLPPTEHAVALLRARLEAD
jgi:DNA-binding GntR family transcriptional regulator